jgi:hypothetical protein
MKMAADLYIALLDPEVSIVRPDGAKEEFESRHEVLSISWATRPGGVPGGSVVDIEWDALGGNGRRERLKDVQPIGVDVRFAGLGRDSSYLESDLERLGIRDLRSGTISLDAQVASSLTFELDTTQTLSFSEEELDEARPTPSSDEETGLLEGIRMSLVSVPHVPDAIAFSALPNVFSADGQAIMRDDGAGLFLQTPAGRVQAGYGAPVWLGETHKGAIQFDLIGNTAWLSMALVLFTVALGCVLLSAELPDRRFFLLLLSVSTLLGMRLLFSFKAFNRYPYSQESLDLGITSFVLVPWALITLRGMFNRGHPEVRYNVCSVAYFVMSLVVIRQILSGAKLYVMVVMCGFLVMASFLRFREPETLAPTRMIAGLLAVLAVVAAVAERHGWAVILVAVSVVAAKYLSPAISDYILDRFRRLRECSLLPRPIIGVFLFPAVLFALRAGLAFLGIRERIPIPGAPVAISILYVPLVITAYAVGSVYWRRRNYEPGAVYLLWWWLFLLVPVGVASAIASDLGFVLIFSILLFWDTIAFRWKAFPSMAVRLGVTIVPLALYLLLQLYPVGAIGWRYPQQFFQPELSQPEEVVRRLAKWNNNTLRLIQGTYPDLVKDIGRRDSDSLAIMHEVLKDYTSDGWWGVKGYFGRPTPQLLGPTGVREHVPAVYGAGDFGHPGVLVLGFVYLVPLLLFFRASSTVEEASPGVEVLHLIGVLSFSFFAVASIYMLAANYNLVLFTGKNAYLLGLDSFGDFLEGMALLSLGVIGTTFAMCKTPMKTTAGTH